MVHLVLDIYQSAVTFADLQRDQVERKREDYGDYYFDNYDSRLFRMYTGDY